MTTIKAEEAVRRAMAGEKFEVPPVPGFVFRGTRRQEFETSREDGWQVGRFWSSDPAEAVNAAPDDGIVMIARQSGSVRLAGSKGVWKMSREEQEEAFNTSSVHYHDIGAKEFAEVLEVISLNLSESTPSRYLRLFERGVWDDFNTTSEDVRAAAKAGGYTSPLMWHGTRGKGEEYFYHGTAKGDWTVFEPNKRLGLIFFGNTGGMAAFFTPRGGGSRYLTVYINPGKMFEPQKPEHLQMLLQQLGAESVQKSRDYWNTNDFEGKWVTTDDHPFNIEGIERTGGWQMMEHTEIIQAIKALGFDSILLRESNKSAGDAQETLAIFDPKRAKSAEPETYDDEGEPIPLNQRFDPNTSDFRY